MLLVDGTYLKKGDMWFMRSTVYPGATEESCVPVLEKSSSLIFNKDFFVGYSPKELTLVINNIALLTYLKLPAAVILRLQI